MYGRFRFSRAAALAFLFLASPPSPAQSTTTEFDLPAQSLAESLRAVAAATRTNVLFDTVEIASRQAPALKGRVTIDEALSRLLAGTGLKHQHLDDKTIVLASVKQPGNRTSSDQDVPPAQTIHLVQADPDEPQDAGEVPEGKTGAPADTPAGKASAGSREEIVVTGSRLKRATAEGPQPVNIYTRADIERSGQTTVSAFLNTRPEISTASSEDGITSFTTSQTTVQIRGLPMGTTLVLLNGRRLETNGIAGAGFGNFFDLNTLPAAFVERIEIVPTGSSAIYGSDALAGVVNVITTTAFTGATATASYGFAQDTSEASATFGIGSRGTEGGVSLVVNYLGRNALRGTDREITADIDYRALGGRDLRDTSCRPGTVYSLDGQDLPGLDAPFAAIPTGKNGQPLLGDFAATAGTENRCSWLAERDLISATERYGVLVSGNYRFAAGVTLYSELLYSNTSLTYDETPIGFSPMRVGMPFVLPAVNPFNPFGEDVRVDFSISANYRYKTITDFYRPLIGLRGELGGRWRWDVAAWLAEDRLEQRLINYLYDFAAINVALADPDPATALNPLLDTSLPAGSYPGLFVSGVQNFTGRTASAQAVVNGSLFDWQAGSVEAAFGAEYNQPTIVADLNLYQGRMFRDTRDIVSMFGEVRAPLLGRAGHDVLALSGAIRRDQYNDFGSATMPQFGLEWRPARSLFVRASYADAFRAPGIYEIGTPKINYGPSFNQISDPRRGGELVTADYLFGGDPNLKAEEGHSRSIGAVWSGSGAAGLQISLTYWDIEQTNRIASAPSSQELVDNEGLFPGRVIRAPDENGQPGRILAVDGSFVNFGGLRAAGFDFGAKGAYPMAAGELAFSLSVTEIHKYEAQIAPNAPLEDRLGKANIDAYAPRWKSAVVTGWERGPLSLTATGRYVGRYQDYSPLSDGSVQNLGNFWLFDVGGRFELSEGLRGARVSYFDKLYVSATIVNAFDSLPKFSSQVFNRAYDPTQYDIRGRFVTLNIGAQF